MFETEECKDVYRGLLEGNLVQILIPSASYTICQKLAAHWGDEKVYLVDGKEVENTGNGGVSLINPVIVGELTKDDDNMYRCPNSIIRKLNHQLLIKREKCQEKGFFGLLNKFIDFCDGV